MEPVFHLFLKCSDHHLEALVFHQNHISSNLLLPQGLHLLAQTSTWLKGVLNKIKTANPLSKPMDSCFKNLAIEQNL